MFWLSSAPSPMPLGSHQGWAHLSRALQAGSAVCCIDFSPGPPKSFSLEAETILSPRVIALHQGGLNKEMFSGLFVRTGLSVLLVLTQPWGPGWQTWIANPAARSSLLQVCSLCLAWKLGILGLFYTAKDPNPLSLLKIPLMGEASR